MSFNSFNLDPRLLKNVQAMDFEEPTPIQAATIAPALEGRDILGSAETGTGKTAAFLLPLLQKLINTPRTREPRALVLVPTRELALQVTEQAQQLSRTTGLKVVTVYGGVGYGPQEDALRKGVDIVIATPGRLIDHLEKRNVNLMSLQVLVLDEADRMLDIGFLPDIRRIMRQLPKERQTFLFSATLQPILALAREVTHDAVRVEVEKAIVPDTVTHALYPVPEHMKSQLLKRLLEEQNLESVLVFTRTKHRADKIVRDLQRAKIPAAVIHGNRSQSQRIAALDAFKRGRMRVLVATDIAARGIDVEGISHVINYDMPMQAEDYVHRTGRTGRAQAIGEAYTLVTPADERMVNRIEYVLKQKIQRRQIDGIDYRTPAAKIPDADAIRRYVEANRRKPQAQPARAR
jgi:ATP-dependent RNA helicase RhlE